MHKDAPSIKTQKMAINSTTSVKSNLNMNKQVAVALEVKSSQKRRLKHGDGNAAAAAAAAADAAHNSGGLRQTKSQFDQHRF